VLEPDKRKNLFKISSKLQKKLLPKLQLLSAKLRRVGKFENEHRKAAKLAGDASTTDDAMTSPYDTSRPMETKQALIAWRLRKRLQKSAMEKPRQPQPPPAQPCPPPVGTRISLSGGPPILPNTLRTTEDGPCKPALADV